GAVWMAVKSLFQRNSPFSINPRFDPTLWGWLFRFARRCNRTDMLEARPAIQALLDSSLLLYKELMAAEALHCGSEPRGLLFVYDTSAAMEEYAKTGQLLREPFHLPARRLDGDELVRMEPALKPGLAGGWFYEHEAHLRPDKLLSSWRRVLESRGV